MSDFNFEDFVKATQHEPQSEPSASERQTAVLNQAAGEAYKVYRAFRSGGFSRKQALRLVQTVLVATLAGGQQR